MDITSASLSFTQYARHMMPRPTLVDSPTVTGAAGTKETSGQPRIADGCVEGPAGTHRGAPTVVCLPPDQPATPAISKAAIADIVGSSSFTDLARRLEPLFEQVSGKLIDRVMSAHDADGDGRIAMSEGGIAPERFDRIDSDRDGFVTSDELKVNIRTELGRALAIDPTLDADAFAKQWIEAFDLDQSGTVTGAESPLAGGIAQRIDADADGRLTAAEIKAEVATRTPAIGRRQRLEELAAEIGRKLDAAGYGRTPPINIREVVDQFGLDKASNNLVMRLLAQRYPQGLGISTFA